MVLGIYIVVKLVELRCGEWPLNLAPSYRQLHGKGLNATPMEEQQQVALSQSTSTQSSNH
jgi:hypothetical protein